MPDPKAESKPLRISLPITAVWLRRIGDHAEVLLEIDGAWRLAITERADGCYSHIAEASGYQGWPTDEVTQCQTP